MRVIPFSRSLADEIPEFNSRGAAAELLASGSGETHVYAIFLEPHGEIGPHPAGFGQLFIPLQGEGWVAGSEGVRVPLRMGEAAFISRGEVHSKGSTGGLIALMIQVHGVARTAGDQGARP
jgi:quercetin dioxygenase-like cupin family protein